MPGQKVTINFLLQTNILNGVGGENQKSEKKVCIEKTKVRLHCLLYYAP